MKVKLTNIYVNGNNENPEVFMNIVDFNASIPKNYAGFKLLRQDLFRN